MIPKWAYQADRSFCEIQIAQKRRESYLLGVRQ